MARAAIDILLRGVRGQLAGVVIRQVWDGNIWTSKMSDFSNRIFSKGQNNQILRSAYNQRLSEYLFLRIQKISFLSKPNIPYPGY